MPPPRKDTGQSLLDRVGDAARRHLNLDLAPETLSRLGSFAELLLYWNRRVNLSGARTLEELLFEHVLDSLAPAPFLPLQSYVADLGSGAGLPGIPLSIARQDCRVCLVESRRKRANFLREAQRQLSLPNVEVVEARAETLQVTHREAFGVVTCRALGKVDFFLKLAAPILSHGGLAIAFQGPSSASASTPSGFTPPVCHWYSLPGEKRRCLAIYRKDEVT